MPVRRVTDHPLHVSPELVGAELGSPLRRFLAIAIDGLLLIVPTLAVGLAAAALFVHHEDPAAYRALRSMLPWGTPAAERNDRAFMRDLAPLLVHMEAPGMPPAAAVAVEEGDADRAAEILADYNLLFTLNILPEEHEAHAPPRTVMIKVEKLIPASVRLVVLLGVPALYFAFFTRRGATIGKWICGLRVVQLAGEKLSWGESLERFAGYVHIPSTFFVGLKDLWHDPNRRMPHDRVVHTAVIRRRALR